MRSQNQPIILIDRTSSHLTTPYPIRIQRMLDSMLNHQPPTLRLLRIQPPHPKPPPISHISSRSSTPLPPKPPVWIRKPESFRSVSLNLDGHMTVLHIDQLPGCVGSKGITGKAESSAKLYLVRNQAPSSENSFLKILGF
jgi:hypothetical protein